MGNSKKSCLYLSCLTWGFQTYYFNFGVGTYVLVIISRKEVGSYIGFPVFRVMSMKFLSCNEDSGLSNYQEV